MLGHDVSRNGPEGVVAYLIDCTLATVVDMAMKKSRPKGEFKRQMGIAQKGIHWAAEMNIDLSSTRAQDIIDNYGGSVETWANEFIH